jgi:hypothetical protein
VSDVRSLLGASTYQTWGTEPPQQQRPTSRPLSGRRSERAGRRTASREPSPAKAVAPPPEPRGGDAAPAWRSPGWSRRQSTLRSTSAAAREQDDLPESRIYQSANRSTTAGEHNDDDDEEEEGTQTVSVRRRARGPPRRGSRQNSDSKQQSTGGGRGSRGGDRGASSVRRRHEIRRRVSTSSYSTSSLSASEDDGVSDSSI